MTHEEQIIKLAHNIDTIRDAIELDGSVKSLEQIKELMTHHMLLQQEVKKYFERRN